MAGRKVVTVWHGDRVLQIIQSEMTRRLSAAGMIVSRHAKVLVGKEGAVRLADQAKQRDSKGRFLKKLRYGANPSAPGEPPHKQTGRLQGSITHELRSGGWLRGGMIARVGTNVVYGRWLELGTRKMRPRPWLKRSLEEVRNQIKAILSRPMRGGDRG